MGNSFFKCVRAGSRIVVTMRYPASHDVGFHATHAAAGRQVFDLDYRFALAPGVIPGIYAWPRQIAVRRAFEPSAAAR